MSFAAIMLGALLIDAVFGWPDRLFRQIGHPVTWIGKVISWLEVRTNRGARSRRIAAGALLTVGVLLLSALPFWILQRPLGDGSVGIAIGAVLAWPLIAARSLGDHVNAVGAPLVAGDLQGGRRAVSRIVGRDPEKLDEAGVARAAIESLAENTADGVVAPVFWGCVAGLPGIAAYKAINTLDSMIGHRDERYEAFGKAAARLDDAVNWIPARLTGLLFALAAGRFSKAMIVMRRDGPQHRSLNAGWPEGGMAAGLNVRLSGPRIYADRVADEPWLNGNAPDPSPDDVLRGLAIYRRAVVLLAALLFVLATV